jgi:hypothetical protein
MLAPSQEPDAKMSVPATGSGSGSSAFKLDLLLLTGRAEDEKKTFYDACDAPPRFDWWNPTSWLSSGSEGYVIRPRLGQSVCSVVLCTTQQGGSTIPHEAHQALKEAEDVCDTINDHLAGEDEKWLRVIDRDIGQDTSVTSVVEKFVAPSALQRRWLSIRVLDENTAGLSPDARTILDIDNLKSRRNQTRYLSDNEYAQLGFD